MSWGTRDGGEERCFFSSKSIQIEQLTHAINGNCRSARNQTDDSLIIVQSIHSRTHLFWYILASLGEQQTRNHFDTRTLCSYHKIC